MIVSSARLLSSKARPVLCPRAPPHTFFNPAPNSLHNLSVPPPALLRAGPLVHLDRQNTPTQIDDVLWRLLVAPAHIDTWVVAEQLSRIAVLVSLELPCLARCEDGHDTAPIGRLERRRGIDEDECDGRRRDGGHDALDTHHVGAGRRSIGGREDAVVEELLDVAHAQEGGGGWREQDDWFETLCGFALEIGDEGGGLGERLGH
jgi:hypothetical protein